MCSNIYSARIISLFVILSEAKNLVVAPARECRIFPLFYECRKISILTVVLRHYASPSPKAHTFRLNPPILGFVNQSKPPFWLLLNL